VAPLTPARFDWRTGDIVAPAGRLRYMTHPWRVLTLLLTRKDRFVSIDEIAWWLWGGENEPTWVANSVSGCIVKVRHALVATDIEITGRSGWGYRARVVPVCCQSENIEFRRSA